ncbi:MAG: FAD-dependent oxidoreductase [Polyangiaceae bacterium]|nr:FAD-dependent oxidoreductase [Polyangiaceae bacterium]
MKVLVIGGGYAGLLCALRLARKSEAEVTLVDGRPHFSERVRLHEDVANGWRRRKPLAELLCGTRVSLRVGWISELDLESRHAGGDAFDELVIATGSAASRPRIPGFEHALTCDVEESAHVTAGHIQNTHGPIVVIGGGLTGLELAAELGARKKHVTLVTDGALGQASLTDASRAYAKAALARFGVELLEDSRVTAIEKGAVVLVNGSSLPSECTIWAGGLAPSPLPRSIGLAVDATGRAIVDDRLRSVSHPFVHVAGDAARVSFGPHVLRMACATAMPMGAYVADDIANRAPRPFQFSYAVQCASLGRASGLAQRVDRADRPVPRFFGGRPAAWLKQGLCRYTMLSMATERSGFSYRWFESPMIAPEAPRLAQRA